MELKHSAVELSQMQALPLDLYEKRWSKYGRSFNLL